MPYRVLLPVLMCCIAAGPATKPLFPGVTTRPGTQPASAPARVRDGLLGGSVRFLVPSQWRLFDRKEDQTQVFYHPSPEVGTVSVMVTPQGSVIRGNDPATRDRIAQTLLGLINKDLATRSVQVDRDAAEHRRIHDFTKPPGNFEDAAVVPRHADSNLRTEPARTNSQRRGHDRTIPSISAEIIPDQREVILMERQRLKDLPGRRRPSLRVMST